MERDHSNKPELMPDAAQDAAAEVSADIQGRRRFLRASAVSGAVLLTLHNRAAWGWENDVTGGVCISQGVLDSFSETKTSAVMKVYDAEIQAFETELHSSKVDENGSVVHDKDGNPVPKYDTRPEKKYYPENKVCYPPYES